MFCSQGLTWVASAMQGWRVSMEDAHIALPGSQGWKAMAGRLGQGGHLWQAALRPVTLPRRPSSSAPWTQTALFGVLDGHGGAQVATSWEGSEWVECLAFTGRRCVWGLPVYHLKFAPFLEISWDSLYGSCDAPHITNRQRIVGRFKKLGVLACLWQNTFWPKLASLCFGDMFQCVHDKGMYPTVACWKFSWPLWANSSLHSSYSTTPPSVKVCISTSLKLHMWCEHLLYLHHMYQLNRGICQ